MKRQKAAQLVTSVLGPIAKECVYEKLQNEKFSLILDEITDVGTTKNLVLIGRFCDTDYENVRDCFIDLIEVKDATAEGVFLSVKNYLIEKKIPFSNMIGFGADNANVMMGEFNSVQQKFSELCPGIVVQGCGCHSLHLVASHAAKKLPSTVEQFTRDIYNYFSNSSKRTDEFRECQIFLEEKPGKMLRPNQTRWLSLKAVCNRILDHWDSLLRYFQQASLEDNLPSARSMLNALKNVIFKMYLQFLSFNLEKITVLNIELQSGESKMPVFLKKIMSLYKTILTCFIKKPIINNTENVATIKIHDPHNYLSLEDIYFGGKVDALLKNKTVISKIDKNDLHSFKLKCLEFYIEVADQIRKRFNFNDEYLKFASLFIQ